MLLKCSVFLATSLDGFIARENGSIDWLMKANTLAPASNLIDELTITLIPVLLGSGRSLFGKLKSDIELYHIESRTLEGGFVQIKYKTKK